MEYFSWQYYVSRHRVIAASAPRMTAADTFDAEPRAFENAVFEHSLHHVLAASRCKAAGRRSERRDKHPVEIHGQQKHLTHYDFPILHTFGRWSMVVSRWITIWAQRYCFFRTYANKKGKKNIGTGLCRYFYYGAVRGISSQNSNTFRCFAVKRTWLLFCSAWLLFAPALLLFRSGLTLFGLGLTLFPDDK